MSKGLKGRIEIIMDNLTLTDEYKIEAILTLIEQEKVKAQESLLAEIIEYGINNAGYDYPFEAKVDELQQQLKENSSSKCDSCYNYEPKEKSEGIIDIKKLLRLSRESGVWDMCHMKMLKIFDKCWENEMLKYPEGISENYVMNSKQVFIKSIREALENVNMKEDSQ